MDSGPSTSENKYVEITPGKAYAKTFKRPDLWGEDTKPHPGRYRVIFTFSHELSTEEASIENQICSLRTNPLVFVQK